MNFSLCAAERQNIKSIYARGYYRLMNNINSIRRESLGNKSPYEATADKSILRLMELMGLHLIPADEIRLTSDLLKR